MTAMWLPLFSLFYIAVMLYWVRVAILEDKGSEGFFSAGHALAPWIAALVIAGASLSGWFVLGGSRYLAETGLQLPVLLVAGILIALPGVVFFKRIWLVAERLRVSSQAGIFSLYYQSPFLVVVSALVAVLFAVGFSALQLRAVADALVTVTDGSISQLSASVLLGIVLFAGTGIGGIRAIAYIGVIQTVLCFSAIIVLAGFCLVWTGGFAALNAGLHDLYARAESAALFNVKNVLLFTPGLGRGGDPATSNTALANLSLAFALMGFQASPLALKLVLSTRSPNGIAAGQTWVMAGFLGALILFGIAILGFTGLLDEQFRLNTFLTVLNLQSPWFGAWIFIGVIAGVQLLAGLSLFVAAESLIRHLYRPYFNTRLSRHTEVSLTRITVAVLALVAMIMQNLTPVTVSALAAVALPISLQLWTPLLGITWLGWITRPAAICGVGFGIAAVILTEPPGYEILSFFGLELPWGRWPWTLHSAAWGLAANAAAVLIISAVTHRDDLTGEAREIAHVPVPGKTSRALRSTAWSVTLGWFFLAVGPGLIFGSAAFVGEEGVWLFAIPSLWVWSMAAWAGGVVLIWFLSYKMEMASPIMVNIPEYTPPRRLAKDNTQQERERLRVLIVTGAVGFGLAVLFAFGFGR